ncbi:MAG: SGNH/GDSL hydrolase family protein [Clostridia bacterium]|nr:SGNH/GDSL hydrolase family protein [Clostridia bacterium]
MKKLTALFLAVIMCLSVTVSVTNASESKTVLYEYKEFADFGTFIRADKSEVFGIGGKSATDSSVKLTLADSTEKTGYMDLSWGKISGTSGAYTWNKSSYTGYLVNEFNIWASSDITYVMVCTNQNADVGGNSIASLTADRWNRITVVTDRSGGTNTGKTATYVNGIQVRSWTADKLGSLNNGQPRNAIRYLLGGATDTIIYMDDLRVYETDSMPDIAPLSLRGDGYAGTNGYLSVSKDIKVSDIIAEGVTVRAYTDSTFAAEVSSDAVIKKGNIVVAEDTESVLWYYELNDWDGITCVAEDISEMSLAKASSEAVYGVLGKTWDDESMKLTDSDTSASDIFYNKSWTPKNTLSNYLVFEINIAPTGSQGYFTLGTNGNASMSFKGYVGSDIKMNQWNKFTVVYDIANQKSDTYVNGRLASKGNTGSYTVGTSNCIRFLMVYTDGDVYIDDLNIYEAIGYPELIPPAAPEDGFDAGCRIIADSKKQTLSISPSKTVADIAPLFAEDNVRVYSDSSCKKAVNSDTALLPGNIVVAETVDKTYSYYTIEEYSANSIKVIGNRYNAEYNTIYDGDINVIAPVEETGIILAAQYDKGGALIKLSMENSTEGYISTSFSPAKNDSGYIKLFLWDGKASLKPLNNEKEIQYTDGQVICFLGDSITQNGKYIRELYEHYLSNEDAIPGVEMYNCGIPGDKTTEALARIDSDCLNYNPDVVFVTFGVNHLTKNCYTPSTYASYETQRAEIMDTYRSETVQIIEKILASGAKAVLCTPPPHNDEASGLCRNLGLEEMSGIIYELAEEYNLDVVDYFGAMKELDPAVYIMSDNVHPNDLGHHVMAQAVLKAFGYVDTIDTGTALTQFAGTNDRRHTESYNYRLALLVDKRLSNYETTEEKKQAAYETMLAQTDAHNKFIYQNYYENCERLDEMKQDVIELTKQTACK